MKEDIKYIETDQRDLDSIGFLWEKLNEHHRIRSPYHAGHFAHMTWDVRKKELTDKSRNGFMRIDLARDVNSDKLVGYCVSTISEEKQGEIDSIFIEKDYRRSGIGDTFMEKSLKWMDGLLVTKRIIGVAIGNEEVFSYYARYNYYPRVTILSQLDTKE